MNPDGLSVLFVCMGNICRSPTAQGVFESIVEERGLADQFAIDSAGTIGHHAGNKPDARMSAAAAKRGFDLSAQRARKVTADDLRDFDLVVAMDRANLSDLVALNGQPADHIRLLGSFLPPEQYNHAGPPDVPDPYYGGDAGFAIVLDMIQAACPRILDHALTLSPSA